MAVVDPMDGFRGLKHPLGARFGALSIWCSKMANVTASRGGVPVRWAGWWYKVRQDMQMKAIKETEIRSAGSRTHKNKSRMQSYGHSVCNTFCISACPPFFFTNFPISDI